jgi:hypothetical protein
MDTENQMKTTGRGDTPWPIPRTVPTETIGRAEENDTLETGHRPKIKKRGQKQKAKSLRKLMRKNQKEQQKKQKSKSENLRAELDPSGFQVEARPITDNPKPLFGNEPKPWPMADVQTKEEHMSHINRQKSDQPQDRPESPAKEQTLAQAEKEVKNLSLNPKPIFDSEPKPWPNTYVQTKDEHMSHINRQISSHHQDRPE